MDGVSPSVRSKIMRKVGRENAKPELADSVVVMDEVHSFDHAMFSALRDILTTFDVPVLCMTATLPEDRGQQMLGCGLKQSERERPEDLRRAAVSAVAAHANPRFGGGPADLGVGAPLPPGERASGLGRRTNRRKPAAAAGAIQGGWTLSLRTHMRLLGQAAAIQAAPFAGIAPIASSRMASDRRAAHVSLQAPVSSIDRLATEQRWTTRHEIAQ
jgi:hypothetical protein